MGMPQKVVIAVVHQDLLVIWRVEGHHVAIFLPGISVRHDGQLVACQVGEPVVYNRPLHNPFRFRAPNVDLVPINAYSKKSAPRQL